jgi:hypothetical protein
LKVEAPLEGEGIGQATQFVVFSTSHEGPERNLNPEHFMNLVVKVVGGVSLKVPILKKLGAQPGLDASKTVFERTQTYPYDPDDERRENTKKQQLGAQSFGAGIELLKALDPHMLESAATIA